MKKNRLFLITLLIMLCSVAAAVNAEPAASADDQLTAISKRIENPVNKISTVPFTYQIYAGVGSDNNQSQNQLYIRPVLPIILNSDWMLISRAVIPLEISTPAYTAQGISSGGYASGIGNIVFSGYLTAREQNSKLLWGLGPVVSTPTATNLNTGNYNWGIGPAAIGVFRDGPWVVGSVINNVWSVGNVNNPENKLDWQFFAHYNLNDGWDISTSPEIFVNWNSNLANGVSLPLGFGISKTFKIDGQLCNAGVQQYYYVLHPQNGPEYMAQFVFSLIFPDYASSNH
ncbi:MAG: hypothetical protein WCV63_03715 [Negativicutes bacterium]|jgi:hypothetical protein